MLQHRHGKTGQRPFPTPAFQLFFTCWSNHSSTFIPVIAIQLYSIAQRIQSFMDSLEIQRILRINPGIVLVTRLWVTRAGGLPAPISPSYQQAGTNMKRRRDRFRYFLLLLFLTRAIKMEIRHGVVIPFDLWTRPLCQPLASGHCSRLGSSTASSGCVHYSLICTSARSCQQTDWQ